MKTELTGESYKFVLIDVSPTPAVIHARFEPALGKPTTRQQAVISALDYTVLHKSRVEIWQEEKLITTLGRRHT